MNIVIIVFNGIVISVLQFIYLSFSMAVHLLKNYCKRLWHNYIYAEIDIILFLSMEIYLIRTSKNPCPLLSAKTVLPKSIFDFFKKLSRQKTTELLHTILARQMLHYKCFFIYSKQLVLIFRSQNNEALVNACGSSSIM
jgi:hypothetical protein